MSIKTEQITDGGQPAVRITWTIESNKNAERNTRRVGLLIKKLHELPAVVRNALTDEHGAVIIIASSAMSLEKLSGRAHSLAGPILDDTSPAM